MHQNPASHWQSIGDIALRLAQEKARHRANDPGLTTTPNEKDSLMPYREDNASEGFIQ